MVEYIGSTEHLAHKIGWMEERIISNQEARRREAQDMMACFNRRLDVLFEEMGKVMEVLGIARDTEGR